LSEAYSPSRDQAKIVALQRGWLGSVEKPNQPAFVPQPRDYSECVRERAARQAQRRIESAIRRDLFVDLGQ